MLGQHPIFVISVAAVVAPLLAQTREGSRVPVVVIEVLLGVLSGPHVLRLTEFEPSMSVCTPRTTHRAISRKVSPSGGKSGPARLNKANSGRPSGGPKCKGTARTLVKTRAYARRKDQPNEGGVVLFGGRMSAGCSYSISSTAKSWVGH
jgi:hypothetical protein